MVHIYVLECEHGKIYVGKTSQPVQRIATHFGKAGSEWTKLYPPIAVIEQFEGDDFDEDKTVKKYMSKHGIQNVRGGSYSQIRLDKVAVTLLQKEMWGASDRCFKCGSPGHFVRDCPQKYKKEDDIKKGFYFIPSENRHCHRCGKRGHLKHECFSLNHIDGHRLPKPCTRCDNLGHSSEECCTRLFCTRCGLSGHKRKQCTTSIDTSPSVFDSIVTWLSNLKL